MVIQAFTQKSRRFMIYVHSKGMIVDDEYLLMGSANINQRSLEGTRDTEIAMGAYQAHHTWAKKKSRPRGQVRSKIFIMIELEPWSRESSWMVNCLTWFLFLPQIYGYRMSLLAEHIGALEKCFAHPESLECVRRVRNHGELNWQQFVANDVTEMRGHLLRYPVDVDQKGKVRPLTGFETFPDVGGKIVGSFFAVQENLTI
ncbi:Phospholipase D beta 1 [Asimina triloba]